MPTNAVRSCSNDGESATAVTSRSSRPALAPAQVSPPSSERRRPSVAVPASTTASSARSGVAARHWALLPTRTGRQLRAAIYRSVDAAAGGEQQPSGRRRSPARRQPPRRRDLARGRARSSSGHHRRRRGVRPPLPPPLTEPPTVASAATVPPGQRATSSQAFAHQVRSWADPAERVAAADQRLGGQRGHGRADRRFEGRARDADGLDEATRAGVDPAALEHVESGGVAPVRHWWTIARPSNPAFRAMTRAGQPAPAQASGRLPVVAGASTTLRARPRTPAAPRRRPAPPQPPRPAVST